MFATFSPATQLVDYRPGPVPHRTHPVSPLRRNPSSMLLVASPAYSQHFDPSSQPRQSFHHHHKVMSSNPPKRLLHAESSAQKRIQRGRPSAKAQADTILGAPKAWQCGWDSNGAGPICQKVCFPPNAHPTCACHPTQKPNLEPFCWHPSELCTNFHILQLSVNSSSHRTNRCKHTLLAKMRLVTVHAVIGGNIY